MYIEIKNGKKVFSQGTQSITAFQDIDLQVDKGEFLCLLGPSGCGKSTLLNVLAGFDALSEGTVKIDGRPVEKPSDKHIMIFQNYGLLPWRTITQNVELGLEARHLDKRERRRIAKHYIELVGLSRFQNNHPGQLSGGMQQRVSIARALAMEPDILFMDEPLGALDAITRMYLQDEILRLTDEEGKTVIFVTHDIEEAVFLADRIVIMAAHPGRISNVIEVPFSRRNRDRTGEDFVLLRDKVFDLMHMKPEQEEPEYAI